METFTRPGITGYRHLNDAEVELMNEGKALAEQCGAYIQKLRVHDGMIRVAEYKVVKEPEIQIDQRWISIGATDLQRGFMAVIRGIERPTTF